MTRFSTSAGGAQLRERRENARAERGHFRGEPMRRVGLDGTAHRDQIVRRVAVGDAHRREGFVEILHRPMESTHQRPGGLRLGGGLQSFETHATEMGHQSPTAERAQ